MAEIFRVLFVALLLNVYWPPSDIPQRSPITDFGIADQDYRTMLKPRTVTGADAAKTHGEGYTPGEDEVVDVLLPFINSGCGAAAQKAANISVFNMKNDPIISFGKRAIINLLSTYILSGCNADAAKVLTHETFSPGEIKIIKLLSTYIYYGCQEAAQDGSYPQSPISSAVALGDLKSRGYSPGETGIIQLLANYFRGDCKIGQSARLPGSDGSNKNAAGRHVQSVVLRLFLSIFGASLTLIGL